MTRPLRPTDPLFLQLMRLATQKDYRGTVKRCVVTGNKLVRDLGRRHHFYDLLSKEAHDPALQGMRAEAHHVAEIRCLRRIAQLTHFDGLVGTLDMPQPSKDLGDPRLVLCLDYVEDPGLLGTLLRTAVAFEWQAAFFLPKCVDPFESRCIRASQGALFDLPYQRGTYADLKRLCKRHGLQFCVSHSHGVDIGSPSYQKPPRGVALLLREEYSSPWAPPKDATKIKVPTPPALLDGFAAQAPRDAAADGDGESVEEPPFEPRSLDVAVAGGILMHHMRYFHYPEVSRSSALASPR